MHSPDIRPARPAGDTRPLLGIGALLLAFLVALLAPPAHAHKASDAYLQLHQRGDTLQLRWDIALRDLDAVLNLDSNGDRQLSWGEVRARMADIQAYAMDALQLEQGRCTASPSQPPAIEDRIDGAYLVLRMQAPCPPGAALDIDYRLFREVDPTHRGLLRLESDGAPAPVLRSLAPSGGTATVAWPRAGAGTADSATNATFGNAEAPATSSDAGFFQDGIHHILIGYDHILFLLCLLLPAVLHRRPNGWLPVPGWREAAWPMLGIVTMFTIAHSITLALAGLKIVTISPRIIEPGIALTIILAAVDNLHPVLRGRRKLFSFLFGLIHGFGFAGALSELDLPIREFVLALLQFNLGVEAGQLMVVGAALVALLALRNWRRYPPLVLRGGSAAAMLVAAIWLGERVLDVKLL